jgi:hypothetical protein
MSEMGHQRRFERALATSAVHPFADISLHCTTRRFGLPLPSGSGPLPRFRASAASRCRAIVVQCAIAHALDAYARQRARVSLTLSPL